MCSLSEEKSEKAPIKITKVELGRAQIYFYSRKVNPDSLRAQQNGKEIKKISAYDSKGKWKKIMLNVFHKLENIKKETDDVEKSAVSKADR